MTDDAPLTTAQLCQTEHKALSAPGLMLAFCLSVAPLAWSEEARDKVELDELEVTLEIFDDSASLEAFELRLAGTPGGNTTGAGKPDELAERMERFDEEVAAAAEDLGAREEQQLEERLREEREAKAALEERLAERHENERMNEIARFDSADEMDELDLAPEVDAPLDDVMEDDEQLEGALADLGDEL